MGSTSVESCPDSGSGEKKGVRAEMGRGAGESLSEEDCDWDEVEN